MKRLRQVDEKLDDIRKGDADASTLVMSSLRGQMDGLQGELRAAFKEKGLRETGTKKLDDAGNEVDVDHVTIVDNTTTWVDVKRERPFTTQSDRWMRQDGSPGPFQKQVLGLLRTAKAQRNLVGGRPPKVAYDFEYGLTQSVHDAMIKLGRQFGVDVEVRGLVLTDSILTVPPLRPDHEKKHDDTVDTGSMP